MSEQNPYAPVGTPSLAPPPGVMVPPSGFAPPPPAGGFAPVPQQSYQSPGMALTELSFAPIPTDAPPAPVEAPPAPSLVSAALPSGGVARRLSIGGRTPLLALLLVLLLAAGAVVFGTGLLKKKDAAPAPIVHKPKVAAVTPLVAPSASPSAAAVPVKPKAVAKPVAKPVVKPQVARIPIGGVPAGDGSTAMPKMLPRTGPAYPTWAIGLFALGCFALGGLMLRFGNRPAGLLPGAA